MEDYIDMYLLETCTISFQISTCFGSRPFVISVTFSYNLKFGKKKLNRQLCISVLSIYNEYVLEKLYLWKLLSVHTFPNKIIYSLTNYHHHHIYGGVSG